MVTGADHISSSRYTPPSGPPTMWARCVYVLLPSDTVTVGVDELVWAAPAVTTSKSPIVTLRIVTARDATDPSVEFATVLTKKQSPLPISRNVAPAEISVLGPVHVRVTPGLEGPICSIAANPALTPPANTM